MGKILFLGFISCFISGAGATCPDVNFTSYSGIKISEATKQGRTQNGYQHMVANRVLKLLAQESPRDAGYEILVINITEEEGTMEQWTLAHNVQNFTLEKNELKYVLRTKGNLHVECKKEDVINIIFCCKSLIQNMEVIVEYENQHEPAFNNLPKTFKVNEELQPGMVVVNFSDYIRDDDCYQEFSLVMLPKFQIPESDGTYFFMLNNTKNQLIVKRPFDFDTKICEFHFTSSQQVPFYLQLQNSDGKEVVTEEITITFQNIDDEPPHFVRREDCNTTCKLPTCKIETGSSTTVSLPPEDEYVNYTRQFYAYDFDTIDAEVIISLLDASPPEVMEMLTITGGLLYGRFYVGEETNTTKTFRGRRIQVVLRASENQTGQTTDNITEVVWFTTVTTTTLQATELTTNQHSQNITLDIGLGSTTKPMDDEGTSLATVVMTVVFIVAGLAIILFVLITVIRLHRARYNVKEVEDQPFHVFQGSIKERRNSGVDVDYATTTGFPEYSSVNKPRTLESLVATTSTAGSYDYSTIRSNNNYGYEDVDEHNFKVKDSL